MAAEIHFNYLTSKNLYAAVFNTAGEVLRTSTEVFETWGTSGRTAVDYDITMTETAAGASMHYIGTFPVIAAAVYRITVYERGNGTPVNSDIAIAEAEIHWDGTSEIDVSTMTTTINAILVADRTAVIVTNETGTGGGSTSPIITTTDPAIP